MSRPAGTGVGYQNPVIAMGGTPAGVPDTHPPTEGCPDPSALRVDNGTGTTWWIYCTSYTWPRTRTDAMPIYRSTDLAHWTRMGSIFPTRAAWPSWGARDTSGAPYGFVWGPDVHRLAPGAYVAYFAVPCPDASPADGPAAGQCIGVAQATSPTGPWTATRAALVSNHANGVGSDGAYDPNLLIDTDGSLYLYWTVTGNGVYARQMTADAIGFMAPLARQVAAHHPLTGGPGDWDNGSAEGTFTMHHGGYYYMFYSAAIDSSLTYF